MRRTYRRAIRDVPMRGEVSRKMIFAETWAPLVRYELAIDRFVCGKCGAQFETLEGMRAHATDILETGKMCQSFPAASAGTEAGGNHKV